MNGKRNTSATQEGRHTKPKKDDATTGQVGAVGGKGGGSAWGGGGGGGSAAPGQLTSSDFAHSVPPNLNILYLMLAASRSSTSKEHWKEVELAALKTIVKKEIGEPAWKDLQVELEVTVAGIYDTLMGSDCLAGGEKLGCCVLHGENKTCDEHRAAAEALYKKHGGDVIEIIAAANTGRTGEERLGRGIFNSNDGRFACRPYAQGTANNAAQLPVTTKRLATETEAMALLNNKSPAAAAKFIQDCARATLFMGRSTDPEASCMYGYLTVLMQLAAPGTTLREVCVAGQLMTLFEAARSRIAYHLASTYTDRFALAVKHTGPGLINHTAAMEEKKAAAAAGKEFCLHLVVPLDGHPLPAQVFFRKDASETMEDVLGRAVDYTHNVNAIIFQKSQAKGYTSSHFKRLLGIGDGDGFITSNCNGATWTCRVHNLALGGGIAAPDYSVEAKPYTHCSHDDGCQNRVIGLDGLCGMHQYGPLLERYGTCTEGGCSNVAIGLHGLCGLHQYGPLWERFGTCTEGGCNNVAIGLHGLCALHTYGPLLERFGICTEGGCNNVARELHGLCDLHQYGTLFDQFGICTVEVCRNVAIGSCGLCGLHQYGPLLERFGTCTEGGCNNVAIGLHGLCLLHKFGICTVEVCSNVARGLHGFCPLHKYGTLLERFGTCTEGGCSNVAIGLHGLCDLHHSPLRVEATRAEAVLEAAEAALVAAARPALPQFHIHCSKWTKHSVKALYDYVPTATSCRSLVKGEMYVLRDKNHPWVNVRGADGEVGWVPANCVTKKTFRVDTPNRVFYSLHMRPTSIRKSRAITFLTYEDMVMLATQMAK